MKNIYIVIAMLAPLLLSCNGNGKKADAYGNFEAIEVMVSAETPGRLTELPIDVGSVLKAGDKVGRIDSTQNYLRLKQLQAIKNALYAKINAAESQVVVAQTQLNMMQKEKNRLEKLFRDSAATQQQFDDITGKYDVAKAQLQAAKTMVDASGSELDALDNQLKQARDMLSKCTIINPVDGTVLERYCDNGELVGAGVPVYKIADLSSLNLRAYISGIQLPNIKIGQEVDVMIDKNKKENTQMKGVIIWISSQAEFTPKIIQTKDERVTLVYAFKVKIKNDGTLKIGMPGEVHFSKQK